MDIIRVRVAQPEASRVTLWERHPAHPGGEIWLAGAGEFDVAATPAVLARLRSGQLVTVETVAAPPEPPATGERPDPEDDPQIDRTVPDRRPRAGRKDGDPDAAGRVLPGEEPAEETSVVTRLTGEGAPASKVQKKPRGGL
jgi:transglutaminase-like putative cysteine protease